MTEIKDHANMSFFNDGRRIESGGGFRKKSSDFWSSFPQKRMRRGFEGGAQKRQGTDHSNNGYAASSF